MMGSSRMNHIKTMERHAVTGVLLFIHESFIQEFAVLRKILQKKIDEAGDD
jgi:hypothetical protein